MPLTQDGRKKISETTAASNRKRTWHPESLEKLSKSHLGVKHRPEVKAKIGLSCRGEKHYRWGGGKTIDALGYVRVVCHSHPFALNSGRVLEHRLVMEAHLGRHLLPTEVVHHINGITTDNRIENLMLFSSDADHARHHNSERKSCPGT